ncbi:hypothetical protein AB5I39_11075 [Sphingomonas sp. MMS24-J45]|uniref:hypothetical protein n=1 Tax=Sphingomonas sp. MMS24-J45 TaxID=3238806 RepID=UPI00384C86BF
MASNDAGYDAPEKRPVWRTPILSDDSIAQTTLGTVQRPGDDGLDSSPGYSTTGIS